MQNPCFDTKNGQRVIKSTFMLTNWLFFLSCEMFFYFTLLFDVVMNKEFSPLFLNGNSFWINFRHFPKYFLSFHISIMNCFLPGRDTVYYSLVHSTKESLFFHLFWRLTFFWVEWQQKIILSEKISMQYILSTTIELPK